MFSPNNTKILELFVWPSDFGLPSIDTECLQCMVAAKLCAAPIKFTPSTKPWKSPSRSLPYLKGLKQKITKFEDFVEYLRSTKQDVVLDNDLVPAQLCEFDAYNCLLKQKLLPALMYLLWVNPANFNAVTHYWYCSQISFPWHLNYVQKIRKDVKDYINSTGKSFSQLLVEAIQVLNLLSAKLGENKYFCGDKPCSMDALIFGYLAPLLRLPLPNDRLQLQIACCPNLVRFVECIISIYLPLTDSSIREQAETKIFWTKRKVEAQKTLEFGRSRKEQKKTENERNKSSTFCDTTLFVTGAIVLSVLFAAHTGIIKLATASRNAIL